MIYIAPVVETKQFTNITVGVWNHITNEEAVAILTKSAIQVVGKRQFNKITLVV